MSDTTSRATQPLIELREILLEARNADDAERIHAALIDVAEALITHAEGQASMIADLRSDLEHKQGIVTRIGGGDYVGPQDNISSDKADELDL
jgi:hypothetical protein